MDYREYAKDLLTRKKHLVSAYAATRCELESLEQERLECNLQIGTVGENEGLRTVYEDRLITVLVALDDCRFRRSVIERELVKIETGLNGLDEYQRDLLDKFYVERLPSVVEDLMEKWYKERSTIYRDKTRALDSFTRSVYGVLQL
jgi:hypothetical protein